MTGKNNGKILFFFLSLGIPHSWIYSPWKLTLYHCSQYWIWQIRLRSAEVFLQGATFQNYLSVEYSSVVQHWWKFTGQKEANISTYAQHKSNMGKEWLQSSPAEEYWGWWPAGGSMGVSIALAAQRAIPSLQYIKHSTPSQSQKEITPLCSVLVWPHLEHCVQWPHTS